MPDVSWCGMAVGTTGTAIQNPGLHSLPRHREINAILAKHILKKLNV